jgi:hypothetical protein
MLAHMPDEYLMSQPIDALFRLAREEKQADTAKNAKGIDAKLHNNFVKAAANPVTITGSDNRSTILHPARFLPGAGVPVQKLWLEARKIWGQDGEEPIGNFDLKTLGCSGCVSARGWETLHKPGSPDLSLKLFTVANHGKSASSVKTVSIINDGGLVVQESWKELSDMAELKLALKNLRIAAQLVMPWNFSFAVLENFLTSNDYMESELAGTKKATVMSSFIDHVFSINAGNWIQEVEFLDAPDLKALWSAWWSTRKVAMKVEPEEQPKTKQEQNNTGKNKNFNKKNWGQQGQNWGQQNQNWGQQGQNWGQQQSWGQQQQQWGQPGQQGPRGGQQGPVPPYSGPPTEVNICRRYNEKTCERSHTNCFITTKYGPLRLYHVCNYTETKAGKPELCKKYHPRPDHK